MNINLWDLCETLINCLHFMQFISISLHDIDCKQTCGKKIYHMNRVSWLKPLYQAYGVYAQGVEV